jgi:hypothetical protein
MNWELIILIIAICGNLFSAIRYWYKCRQYEITIGIKEKNIRELVANQKDWNEMNDKLNKMLWDLKCVTADRDNYRNYCEEYKKRLDSDNDLFD